MTIIMSIHPCSNKAYVDDVANALTGSSCGDAVIAVQLKSNVSESILSGALCCMGFMKWPKQKGERREAGRAGGMVGGRVGW